MRVTSQLQTRGAYGNTPPRLAEGRIQALHAGSEPPMLLSMRSWIVGFVGTAAFVFLAFLVVGWCRSLGPDVDGAKREVERVIPEHMEVLSVTGDDCGLSIAARCSIEYVLRGDAREYVDDGRQIRDGLLHHGWTETGYSEDGRAVSATYRKGNATLAFIISSAERLAACSRASCQSRITITPK